MTQQRLQGPGVHPGAEPGQPHLLETLMQLQGVLLPLCQQEVAWIASHADTPAQLAANPASTAGEHMTDTAGTQQQDNGQQPQAAPGPWDWDYLQHKATQSLTSALQQESGLLQQHLQLSGVVAGFAALLHNLLGLQLVPRAAAGAEVWAPHVLVLDVVHHGQQPQQQAGAALPPLLGTIHVDIGGSYGARVLRYARSTPSSGGAAYQHAAVAVGISGSRIPTPAAAPAPAPAQQQQHQQQHNTSNSNSTSTIRGGAAAEADGAAVPQAARLVLSVSQLWELAHELGHAVHLVASSR